MKLLFLLCLTLTGCSTVEYRYRPVNFAHVDQCVASSWNNQATQKCHVIVYDEEPDGPANTSAANPGVGTVNAP